MVEESSQVLLGASFPFEKFQLVAHFDPVISNDSRDIKPVIQDMNLLFIKDDKFLGEFNADKKVIVERSYLDHTPTRRIYFTKVSQKYKPAKAQLVIVHGFAASSNFVEVTSLYSSWQLRLLEGASTFFSLTCMVSAIQGELETTGESDTL